jgi:mannitol-1-phosphate/altronate dehydrogenase
MGQAGETAPVRVVQFGEGRLLRALIDPVLDTLYQGGRDGLVAVTNLRPTGEQNIARLREREGRYAVLFQDDASSYVRRITVTRPYSRAADWATLTDVASDAACTLLITNATESGVVVAPETTMPTGPASTAVGLVTQALYARWRRGGLPVTLLPTELLPDNGPLWQRQIAAQIRAWSLPDAFGAWVEETLSAPTTLVDRIVPDPTPWLDEVSARIGERDPAAVVAERYGRWWIEQHPDNPWPSRLAQADPVVQAVPSVRPYFELKVYSLNGPHLWIACAGLERGYETVADAFSDPAIRTVVEEYWREVRPYIAVPEAEQDAFVEALRSRLAQSWIRHRLADIAVRVVDKWQVRVAPVLEAAFVAGRPLPPALVETTRAVVRHVMRREARPGATALDALGFSDANPPDWVLALDAALQRDERP